jgi:hypothetical protein
MSASSEDEALVRRLLDLPANEQAAFWERLCAENPEIGHTAPQIIRLLRVAAGPNASHHVSIPAALSSRVQRVLPLALEPAELLRDGLMAWIRADSAGE